MAEAGGHVGDRSSAGVTAVAAGSQRMGSQRMGSQRMGSQRLAVGSGASQKLGSQRMSSVRMRKMTETVLKEPVLAMCEFGHGKWEVDVVAWPHNAIRRELQDMYYLVASMQKRVLDLTHEDIEDFYDWFSIFEMFVQWYFQYEEKLLMPWVEAATSLNGALEERRRIALKESLVGRLDDIFSCQDRFANLPAGEVLPALVVAVDKFSPPLLEYMGEQEKSLPPALLQVYSAGDKDRYDERVFEFVRNSEDNHLIMHLLLRPVKLSQVKVDLRRKYLGVPGFLAKIKFKRTYELSKKDFREQHVDIVKQFYKRWGTATADAVLEEERLQESGGPMMSAKGFPGSGRIGLPPPKNPA
ncbi:hypothetical protein FVE85_9299 [Porphyridium purpureum]|uniref:Hemerythrin-like domain-containing protein n=1 Tax=Porphyridium purpureum TaxID=35688 RepID=A0A5J4YRI8_PORPP|nr:hypothetical protein FVE85_9299 [Porphyridium purpureum]|eukprot:POR7521..scf222_8